MAGSVVSLVKPHLYWNLRTCLWRGRSHKSNRAGELHGHECEEQTSDAGFEGEERSESRCTLEEGGHAINDIKTLRGSHDTQTFPRPSPDLIQIDLDPIWARFGSLGPDLDLLRTSEPCLCQCGAVLHCPGLSKTLLPLLLGYPRCATNIDP